MTATLQITAYTGAGTDPTSVLGTDAASWMFKNAPQRLRPLMPDGDEVDWKDPRSGWGLVLADDATLTPTQRAKAEDAPEPIRELLRERRPAIVLRYRADSRSRFRLLYDATSDVDVSTTSSPCGVRAGCLPRYLLIYGSPDRIPWQLQYVLNGNRCVGRLDLQGEALENYVGALLSGWAHMSAAADAVLIWSTNRGASDVTARGHDLLATALFERLSAAHQSALQFLDGYGGATAETLAQTLHALRPRAIATTSTGCSAPLDDTGALARSLGGLMDQNDALVRAEGVLAAWDPSGAVWSSHASYSAGCDGDGTFDELAAPGSSLHAALLAAKRVGPIVAPFARALLGAKRPLRAFVGHVGPVFQTSLQVDEFAESFASRLVNAVCESVQGRTPIAHAMYEHWFKNLDKVFDEFDRQLIAYNSSDGSPDLLVRALLVAHNLKRTAILGDPVVAAR